jgi:hypothetical protein
MAEENHLEELGRVLTDQQPPLQPAEREIVKSYGGWTAFMQSYGLKPFDDNDVREALQIERQMARNDRG